LEKKDIYIVKPKWRSFGFNQNDVVLASTKLYITIKIKKLKIKNTYWSYRLTDNRILTDRLSTNKLISINFLTDYQPITIGYGYISSVNIDNRSVNR
jgi:hypothetical protein